MARGGPALGSATGLLVLAAAAVVGSGGTAATAAGRASATVSAGSGAAPSGRGAASTSAARCALGGAPIGTQVTLTVLPPGVDPGGRFEQRRVTRRYVSADVLSRVSTVSLPVATGGSRLEYRGFQRFRWHLRHGAKLCRVDVLRRRSPAFVRVEPHDVSATGGTFDDKVIRGHGTASESAGETQIDHLIEQFVVTAVPPAVVR